MKFRFFYKAKIVTYSSINSTIFLYILKISLCNDNKIFSLQRVHILFDNFANKNTIFTFPCTHIVDGTQSESLVISMLSLTFLYFLLVILLNKSHNVLPFVDMDFKSMMATFRLFFHVSNRFTRESMKILRWHEVAVWILLLVYFEFWIWDFDFLSHEFHTFDNFALLLQHFSNSHLLSPLNYTTGFSFECIKDLS